MTDEELLQYEKEMATKIARESGSKWDLWMPYDINIKVLELTEKLIFEWIIYLVILTLIIIYIYKCYKTKWVLKKFIAREIVYHTVLVLLGVLLFYIPIIYNESGDERIYIKSVSKEIKWQSFKTDKIYKRTNGEKRHFLYEEWPEEIVRLDQERLRKRLTEFGFDGNYNSLIGNRIQKPTKSIIIKRIYESRGDETYRERPIYSRNPSPIKYIYNGQDYVKIQFKVFNPRRHLISRHHYSYQWFDANARKSYRDWSIAKSRGAGHQIYMIIDFVLFAVIIRFLFLLVMWVSKTLKS